MELHFSFCKMLVAVGVNVEEVILDEAVNHWNAEIQTSHREQLGFREERQALQAEGNVTKDENRKFSLFL